MSNPTPPAPEPIVGASAIQIICKTPWGLRCEIGRISDGENYRQFLINGTNSKTAMKNAQGWALTSVPAKDWNDWLSFSPRNADGKVIAKEPNRSLPVLKNGLIYAHESVDHVMAHSIANADRRTGLERLDPAKMPAKVKKYDATVNT